MLNYEYCAYTYRHRKALMYLIEKKITDPELKKKMIEKAKVHDMDKMFLYKYLPKKIASEYHRSHASHHMENDLPKTFEDKIEAVFDYECAAYTKPDKPLNAYDTLINYYQGMESVIMPILEEMEIDESNLPMDEDILKLAQELDDVSIEEIVNELKESINLLTTEQPKKLILE